MTMPHAITVPRLGWSMEEGTFGEWLKQDGDSVERGEPLFVLEGEKSAQDVESLESGILRIPPAGPQPGETVKVGQILAYLVEAGERAPFETDSARMPPIAAPIAAAERSLPPASDARSLPAAGPATRRLARNLQVDLQRVRGSGPGGKVTPDDVRAAVPLAPEATRQRPAISPRARRVARELGIDWSTLRGTGRTGRIRERDVRAAAGPRAAALDHGPPGVPAASSDSAAFPATILPISKIRRAIAARMSAGVHEAAPVTLTTKCDATNLVNLRQQFRHAAADGNAVPGYNDLILKLVAAALPRHAELTRQWHEQGIRVPRGMHLALAVDTEAGLLAPVLRDVDRLTLRQIASRTRQLIEAARSGRLAESDLCGGVFTITNLGHFGIDAFTPILNLPQSAILGVGRIAREPAVVNDVVVPRDQMTLSLTFDHRVVDGAPAARFLQTLTGAIEAPGAWLVP
jgi:pyruvate dehydrogenase E2 component (dihydrolipoamide acetyltransferase)